MGFNRMTQIESFQTDSDCKSQILEPSIFSEDSFDVLENNSSQSYRSNTIKSEVNTNEVISKQKNSDEFSFLIISVNLSVLYIKVFYSCIVLNLVCIANWVLVILSILMGYIYFQVKGIRSIQLGIPNGFALGLTCITVELFMLPFANSYIWLKILVVLTIVACAAFTVHLGNEIGRIRARWAKKMS